MEKAENLVRMIDKSTIQGEPHLKRRTIICYILQSLPWLLYMIFLMLISIINAISEITKKNSKALSIVIYSSTGSVVAIMLIGLILACKNKARGLSIILVLVFLIDFTIMAASYLSWLFETQSILYAYALVVPFLILTIANILGVIILKNPEQWNVYGIIIWAISVLVPSIMFILDEVFDPDGTHFQLFLEILVGTLLSIFCFARDRKSVV